MTTQTFPLWQGPVPGALGSEAKDIPTITVYPAVNGRNLGGNPALGEGPRPAMVVLPGGGYRVLAEHEGPAYAEWLSRNGFTSFLVTYRLAADGYRWPCMLWDAARAMRWVRAHAGQYQVDPERIGMIGSSAGGHLLASLATHYDDGDPQSADPIERFGSRPALGVLCYAPLSMDLLAPTSNLVEKLLGPTSTPNR
jgi:acetyl esterase/lipase